jgi:hypothetical protein
MQPPADPARDGAPGDEKAPARPAAFIPLAFADGLGWIPVSGPQTVARAACLNATAHIHLVNPALPLRDLDARAEEAINALENGAASGHHRRKPPRRPRGHRPCSRQARKPLTG